MPSPRAILAACFLLAAIHHAAAEDVETVLSRMREPLVAGPLNTAEAAKWLEQLGADGRWPDVDYAIAPDRQKAYAPADHQKRCRALALMLAKKQGELSTVLPKLGEALAVNLRYKHDREFTWAHDWYATHIGVPMIYGDTLVLLDGIMPRRELLRYVGHLRNGLEIRQMGGRGMQFEDGAQNLQWVARVTLFKAAVERDEKLMRKAFEAVSSTIEYQREAEEGIKVDAMFHQHGRQIYNGGYGLWYVSDMVNWFGWASGTSFASEFRREQFDIFRHMLLEGHQWVAHKGVTDFGTRGRNITRPGNQRGVPDSTLQRMADFDKAHAPRYAEWIAHNQGGPFPEPGNRHFWKSDFMVHRGAEWYASAKMISNRTTGTETMNGENLMGFNLPLGATCIMTHGSEYEGLQPVWDWCRIPGTTATLDDPAPSPHVFNGSNPFCGGASDDRSGVLAASFDYRGVRVSKAVFAMGDALVCLTAGIRSKSSGRVATSLNQCLLNGTVLVDGKPLQGESMSGSARWIHHDNVGYVVLTSGGSLEVRAETRSGSWRRISEKQSPDPVTRPVFSVWLDHCVHPSGAACAYLVLPGFGAAACERLAGSHGFMVARNDDEVQAVVHPETGWAAAVFHKAGSFDAAGDATISSDRPAVLLISTSSGRPRVMVGDPLCEASRIRVTIAGRDYTATMGRGDSLGRSVEAQPTDRRDIYQKDR